MQFGTKQLVQEVVENLIPVLPWHTQSPNDKLKLPTQLWQEMSDVHVRHPNGQTRQFIDVVLR